MNINFLTKTLVSETVLEVSPEEVVLIDEYDPDSNCYGRTALGPQGFGVEATVFLILPYVYRFFEKFMDKFASNSADDAYKVVRSWLDSSNELAIDNVRALIGQELRVAGVPEEKVGGLAEGVIKVLRKHGGLILAEMSKS